MSLFVRRSRRLIRSGGIAEKGLKGPHMTILSNIRDRLSGPATSIEPKPTGDPQAGPAQEAETRPPYAGYDRLDKRQVMDGFSDHSQVELEAAESYERANKDREPVLDKLRYMRGREPIAGYDALDVEEIVTELQDADLATIKKVRGYERKFGNRPEVLEEVIRVHGRHRASQPEGTAPGYQPLGGALAASTPSDRPEGSDQP
jgi:hypothetical protein